MDNTQIASIFEEMADMLQVQGANIFRVNAYRRGAQIVANYSHDMRGLVEHNREELNHITGIGPALRDKIIELVVTGSAREYEEMKASFPPGLLEMLRLRSVGPKKVQLFYSQLRIDSLDKLKKAAEGHMLQRLPGMGPKSEEEVLRAIEELSTFSVHRSFIHDALAEAERILDYLKGCREIVRVQYAGSLRRFQETIGDIDLLAAVKNPSKHHEKVMRYFAAYEEVRSVRAQGETKSSVLLKSGIQVDLRILEPFEFGAALHYFTGDKAHNIRIRDLARRKGLKVNEYGVFKGETRIGGKEEAEVFAAVGLPYIIPELRKDDGEIEYGLSHKAFPEFVAMKDIRGDLHTHSTYSDGKHTIGEMAEAFVRRGYEYFAMTDHSSVVGVTGGMGDADIRRQWKEIDDLNKKYKGKIRILRGCEVDILKDGGLDFGDDILKELDIVVISAHLYQKMSPDAQTKRLIAAIENPYSRILGHPTGRLINRRSEMEFDMEKVINACVLHKVALEINSNPHRLDLADKYIRMAKEKGARFAVNTDSHHTSHSDFMVYGVGMARRGWLEKADVVNTWPLKEFDNYF